MSGIRTHYERLYAGDEYYWGVEPASFCEELIRLRPWPTAKTVLDIGCGEGKDAVYLAQQGYSVTAFDIAESGIAKARRLAALRGTAVQAYVDDINTFQVPGQFDIIYSSGTLQYLSEENKPAFFEKIGAMANPHAILCLNVFVDKPFLALPPDWDAEERLWLPGELFTRLAEWKFHRIDEILFEDRSGGTPHYHCMDTILCEKMA